MGPGGRADSVAATATLTSGTGGSKADMVREGLQPGLQQGLTLTQLQVLQQAANRSLVGEDQPLRVPPPPPPTPPAVAGR